MTNGEIVRLLRAYNSARGRVREIRAEMLRVAVEELGMDQREAKQENLGVFLDGYLVGQGVQQAWRQRPAAEDSE